MESIKIQQEYGSLQPDMEMNSLLALHNFEIQQHKIEKPFKLAIFDLDNTIIQKSEKGHDYLNWKYIHQQVPKKLRELQSLGYLIIIITNQLGISRKYIKQSDFVQKMGDFLVDCNIKAYILAATQDDEFRKPCIGSYDYLLSKILKVNYLQKQSSSKDLFINSSPLKQQQKFNSKPVQQKNSVKSKIYENLAINFYLTQPTYKLNKNKQVSKYYAKRSDSTDIKINSQLTSLILNREYGLSNQISPESFYCGDAAGRLTPNPDFSDSDLLFANNINMNFCVPEQLFLNHNIPLISPFSYFKFFNQICQQEDILKQLRPLTHSQKKNQLILLIGPPNSGKTTFAQQFLSQYNIISYKKGISSFNNVLEEYKKQINKEQIRLVVDTINTDRGIRQKFLQMLGKRQVQTIAILMNYKKEFIYHLCKFRKFGFGKENGRQVINTDLIEKYYCMFEYPVKQEGFQEIINIEKFCPVFKDNKLETYFFLNLF